tara:strand:+ start:47 stop:241 length:195 start_codon:yes stop_codon:yes gene_type:complete
MKYTVKSFETIIVVVVILAAVIILVQILNKKTKEEQAYLIDNIIKIFLMILAITTITINALRAL